MSAPNSIGKELTASEPSSSRQLRLALNAAITTVYGNGIFADLKAKWNFKEIIVCTTCAADASMVSFPDGKEGRLSEILKSKKIRVAGLQYVDLPAGDYTKSPPIGFFPDFLFKMIDIINDHYNTKIEVEFMYSPTSQEVLENIKTGKADMTDIYYILSAKGENNMDRTESFSITCSSGAFNSRFFVLKSTGIMNVTMLHDAIVGGKGNKVGFISYGDYMVAKPVLPPNAVHVVAQSVVDLKNLVKSGQIIAAMTSTDPPDEPDLQEFSSEIVSPRAALLLKDKVVGDGAMSSSITVIVVAFVAMTIFTLLV